MKLRKFQVEGIVGHLQVGIMNLNNGLKWFFFLFSLLQHICLIKLDILLKYIYTHTHTHTHTYTHIHIYIYTYVYIHIYIKLVTLVIMKVVIQQNSLSVDDNIYIYIFTNLISTSIHGTRKKRKKPCQEQEIKVFRITAQGKKKKL